MYCKWLDSDSDKAPSPAQSPVEMPKVDLELEHHGRQQRPGHSSPIGSVDEVDIEALKVIKGNNGNNNSTNNSSGNSIEDKKKESPTRSVATTSYNSSSTTLTTEEVVAPRNLDPGGYYIRDHYDPSQSPFAATNNNTNNASSPRSPRSPQSQQQSPSTNANNANNNNNGGSSSSSSSTSTSANNNNKKPKSKRKKSFERRRNNYENPSEATDQPITNEHQQTYYYCGQQQPTQQTSDSPHTIIQHEPSYDHELGGEGGAAGMELPAKDVALSIMNLATRHEQNPPTSWEDIERNAQERIRRRKDRWKKANEEQPYEALDEDEEALALEHQRRSSKERRRFVEQRHSSSLSRRKKKAEEERRRNSSKSKEGSRGSSYKRRNSSSKSKGSKSKGSKSKGGSRTKRSKSRERMRARIAKNYDKKKAPRKSANKKKSAEIPMEINVIGGVNTSNNNNTGSGTGSGLLGTPSSKGSGTGSSGRILVSGIPNHLHLQNSFNDDDDDDYNIEDDDDEDEDDLHLVDPFHDSGDDDYGSNNDGYNNNDNYNSNGNHEDPPGNVMEVVALNNNHVNNNIYENNNNNYDDNISEMNNCYKDEHRKQQKKKKKEKKQQKKHRKDNKKRAKKKDKEGERILSEEDYLVHHGLPAFPNGVPFHDDGVLPAARMVDEEKHWYEQRKAKFGCVCIVLVLLVVIPVAILVVIMGNNNNASSTEANENENAGMLKDGTTLVPTLPPIILPTLSPSNPPSMVPSISSPPSTHCTQTIATPLANFGLYGIKERPTDKAYAPKVATDGKDAVVVSNDGSVRFYTLDDNDVVLDAATATTTGGVDADNSNANGNKSNSSNNNNNKKWNEVAYFPNINRVQGTPSVALSGNVAVVGFLYQLLGFDRGVGGAYVYEKDAQNGRWKRTDVLTPEEKDDGIDSSAKFAWAVDVDARQREPLIVVGAHGENYRAGSVYVFRQNRRSSEWTRIGKIHSDSCVNGHFGYSVAVHGNLIASTSDCNTVVQLNRYNATSQAIETYQNIRYIDYGLGAISSLIMNENYMVYSTVFGGLAIYEYTIRRKSGYNNRTVTTKEFTLSEQWDFSGKYQNITRYPLAMDQDVLAVGVANEYWIFPKQGGNDAWIDNANYFSIKNVNAEVGVASVAVSGRDVLVGSGTPHEVHHYDISNCMHDMPTSSPTISNMPTTPVPTLSPTVSPSVSVAPTGSPTTKEPTMPPTLSFQPTPSPTVSPSVKPTELRTASTMLTASPTIPSSPDGRTACVTEEQCRKKSETLGMTSFSTGNYPSKGCFAKNGRAFYSPGTLDEMLAALSSGNLNRIWCGGDGEEDGETSAAAILPPMARPSSGPSLSPATSANTNIFLKPTDTNPTNVGSPTIVSPTPATDSQMELQDPTACLTQDECYDKSIELGVLFYPGNFITKGCFLRNGNVYFSLGTEEEMSTPELSGRLERLWCDEGTRPSTALATASSIPTKRPTIPPTIASSNNQIEQEQKKVCLTEEECQNKSEEMNLASFFLGNYPNKGCFAKKDKAFFSPGTEEEMSNPVMFGNVVRIWC